MIDYYRLLKILLKLVGIVAAIFLILFIAFYLLVECGGKWSEKKRQKFAEECAQTTTIDNLYISLLGFDHSEVDTIFIKQIHENRCIDSFPIFVKKEERDYELKRKQHWVNIDKPITITDTYHIVVPNVQTFILKDMEMVMWAQYTMFSEGWGCVMGSYTIDSVRFEHDSNPTFIKEGYEYPNH